ncbi:pyruvate carboxylase subunit B [Dehalogenimonas alkenigignens]|uniref:Pyruvate carboxylase subunit B n=1 Tax=Dehalogenimonas alkenigignens TaxID=1217799 RepID=A0A0W0GI28_9CHLR|nr:pyruvate carboxylase subunit B [Dehalogenimonas alkenigignens]KTB48231.1 pyruvate carboxylase subunit B [Dehalogenimonas alkenigignens]
MPAQPLKITDLTLRDGHQSLFATRMRTDDILGIIGDMDQAGFHSMEVWGGATFDVPIRFLNEDPWDRLREMKKRATRTPLQMLLRGQNLVGYRNYADDVVTAFVEHAADCGVDIFRVFDAVNDERNFETALAAIKSRGKHAQLAISYSLTERTMGGPVYNLDYYIEKAKKFEAMGADSFCIKDMAGIIAPNDAYTLVKALKKALKIPVQFHTHYTSGMASMSMYKAVEAGADIVDTCLAPWALRTSHPAVEPFVAAFSGQPRDTGLNLHQLLKLGDYFESITPKYRDFQDTTRMSAIDTAVLEHQVPGGMISNLVSQLREAGALNRIDEVYEEIPRVRREMGFPPLVTPTSQIVGIQAVQNVLFGRYKVISAQVKDYFYGLYGRPPMPVDPEIQRLALKGYERGESPITVRPADVLKPELEAAKEATKGIARDIGDVLTYALYPQVGLRFLKWKYGLETPPADVKAKTLDDVKREDELIAKARAGKLAEKTAEKPAAPAPSPVSVPASGLRHFNVHLDGKVYCVGVEPTATAAPAVYAAPPAQRSAAAPPPATAVRHEPVEGPKAVEPPKPVVTPKPVESPVAEAEAKPAAAPEPCGEDVLAPMPGVVLRYEVKVGDKVKSGDTVVVLEAMKMAIDLPSPADGTVAAVKFGVGDRVSRDDVLAIIVP